MPLMDGLEATSYIRTIMKLQTPIIALSASSFEDEHQKCIDAGMNACIVKPIDIIKLTDAIKNLGDKNPTAS
jgi:CheY-like chemotaxis protein